MGTYRVFCTADRCPVIVGSTFIFRDDDDVTSR